MKKNNISHYDYYYPPLLMSTAVYYENYIHINPKTKISRTFIIEVQS